ncbi:TetR/AcrR family transcriptional regulator [Glycomyces albidus]|jgi:TetR/AcrR family transcriptional repressor of mexJK operon|uniref:TetR family transcriptional regulator n=1 Tax=Glycomyces albidus TaxID=2656774 RepID=A0A6L5G4V4_9ACTN|nr:TetR/AcrR family transcriptional regulator [Glycomyces albidus]MQM24657.1 TetR family transcriptional regulator [Glycomyces albidus]
MTNGTRRRGRPSGKTGADLIAAAREVFLESGYAGTTMDAVAARAQISKASLYREHPSKDALFAAVVRAWTDAGRDAMRPHLQRLVDGDDTRADLIHLAEVMRRGILSRDVLNMRRLITSEAKRLPHVAAEYLEESWERNIRALADALRALGHRGRLRLDDPLVAADQLTWLVIGSPLNRLLLTDTEKTETPASPVANAVDLFLAGYGPGAAE